jgi:hypothetical protein
MRRIRGALAGILALSMLVSAPMIFAAGEFVLVGGTRAVIEGKQLILIDKDSRRSVAPQGRYDTRDGRYSIVIKGKDLTIVDHTTVPR